MMMLCTEGEVVLDGRDKGDEQMQDTVLKEGRRRRLEGNGKGIIALRLEN